MLIKSLNAVSGFNVLCFIFEADLGFGESRCSPVCLGCVPNQHLFLCALECALTSVKCTGANFGRILVERVELTGLGKAQDRNGWRWWGGGVDLAGGGRQKHGVE